MTRGRDLTIKQREKLFLTWCECRSIRETARKCLTSTTTVQRYMDEDHWWDRHQDVLKKTQKATNDKAVYNLTNELAATDFFIKNHIKKLAELIKGGKFRGSSKEFRKLIKTKSEILERVEPEVPVDPERDQIAELLEKFSQDAIVSVAEAIAVERTRHNGKSKDKQPTKP